MTNIIEFPSIKTDTVSHDNIDVVANEDEFSVSINNTSIKVSYMNDGAESFALLQYGDFPPAVIPRDIFQTFISAVDMVGDIDNENQWIPKGEFPVPEWGENE